MRRETLTMHTTSTRPSTRGLAWLPQTVARLCVHLLVVGGLFLGVQAAESRPALQTTLSAGVSERFDSNLMLQNDGPLARLHSWVTSVQPVAGLEWSPPGATPLKLGVQYAPDFTFFHDRDEESYLRHVGLLRLSLKEEPWAASARVRAQFTDGSPEGPVWSTPDHPGSPPALGGPEVRYRRRNFYWQSPLEARYDLPRAYLRGVFEARLWDIMTDFKLLPGAFYQNYMDRTDVNGGVDLGVRPGRGWETAVGYRFGHQDQERLPVGLPYTYQNDYHRVLGAFNASPARWLKFGGELGPSFHQFNPASLPPGARDTETLLYFQADATLTLSSNTTFKAAAYQHLLPSTAGRANFQNIRATGTLEHRFRPAVRGSFRFDFQEYDFVRGLALRDEVFTVETRLEYTPTRHLTLAAWYAHEWAQALHPGTGGREYDRHVAGLSVTVKP